jgi:hypothetical protein
MCDRVVLYMSTIRPEPTRSDAAKVCGKGPHKPKSQRAQRGLRSTLKPELGEKCADVHSHGFFGDAQLPRDLFVCKSVGEHLEDLQFASGQMFWPHQLLHGDADSAEIRVVRGVNLCT